MKTEDREWKICQSRRKFHDANSSMVNLCFFKSGDCESGEITIYINIIRSKIFENNGDGVRKLLFLEREVEWDLREKRNVFEKIPKNLP